MDLTKILLFFTRSESQLQTQSCFLQLPIELLLKIFELLPIYSQLIVYQTCRPFRIIIHQHFLVGSGGALMRQILATRWDKLHYLTHRARSMPDRWDTPASLKLHRPECGDGKVLEDENESRKFFNYGYDPSHRHVELTLKYSRLENLKSTHRKHLERLLAPYHTTSNYDVTEGVLSQRSFYPKVVNGRYLLLTSLDYISICPHLYWTGRSQRQLDTTLYRAFSQPNIRHFSSCYSCSTDISMELSKDQFIICAWQDLGPEGTIYDRNWAALVRETARIYHWPGTVRELYGPQEHNGQVLECGLLGNFSMHAS
ncbi:hypothetical protein V8C35DRAFT_321003 [Trichoderma chlorosporum]